MAHVLVIFSVFFHTVSMIDFTVIQNPLTHEVKCFIVVLIYHMIISVAVSIIINSSYSLNCKALVINLGMVIAENLSVVQQL